MFSGIIGASWSTGFITPVVGVPLVNLRVLRRRRVWHQEHGNTYLKTPTNTCLATFENDGLNKVSIEFFEKSYDQVQQSVDFRENNSMEVDECVEAFAINIGSKRLTQAEALRLHQRYGHFAIEGLNHGTCQACQLGKNHTAQTGKNCPEHLKPTKINESIHFDFVGPFPESHLKNLWLLVGIDSFIKWVECYPLRYKSENASALQRWCTTFGVPQVVRSDNEATFKGQESQWFKLCTDKNIRPEFPPPYSPQLNGLVERFMRTLSENLRALMHGVDPKLWDWGARFIAHCYNRIPRKYGAKTPYERRWNRPASLNHIRRFGCEAFIKIPKPVGKLSPRFQKGVFLGFSSMNSSYIIGVWRKRGNTDQFCTLESRHCKFSEENLVASIATLKGAVVGTCNPCAPTSAPLDGTSPNAELDLGPEWDFRSKESENPEEDLEHTLKVMFEKSQEEAQKSRTISGGIRQKLLRSPDQWYWIQSLGGA